MSKMMESKQTAPSVIAKLMGLDELQPQHLSHRPLKVLSEDYLRKSASIGWLEKSSVHVKRLSRITAGKQHVSKNEIRKNDKRIAQSVPDVKPIPCTVRAQFSSARQKNAYAKNFHSIDKEIYHAEELNRVLEDLHVAGDCSLRYFDLSNLSSQQIHDPKSHQLLLLSGHMAVPKISNVLNCRVTELCRKSAKMSTERNVFRSNHKLENDSGESDVYYLDEFRKTHSKLKDEAGNNSSRIVVLQPNSKKTRNCAMGSFLLGHDILCQDGDVECMRCGDFLKSERKVTENENTTRGMEPRRKFRNTGLVDKKAAPEDRINVGISHKNASKSMITVEESSLHLPEALMTSYQGPFYLRRREQSSNPSPSESSFAREAKNQIFERWKTTKNLKEVAVSGRRCTLGQMFAKHDGEARYKGLHSRLENNFFTSLVPSNKVNSTNEYIRNIPNPKLSKLPSITTETPHPKTRIKASQNWCSRQSKTVTDYKLSSSNITCSGSHDILPVQLNQGVEDELEKDMRKEADGHSSSDALDNLTQQKSSYESPKGELFFRCTATNSESIKSLREINQPSPDSVLEPPFKEENDPISELFDSPVSDLSGLAMKLHLLNTKSEETSLEGSVMAVSSDEDTEEGSVDLSQDYEKHWEPLRPAESRDFSYLIDVLDEATLCDLNLDTWCVTCHEMEYPLSHSVFEALEKKYGKQASWQKSERRLLFDCINSGLRLILDSYMHFRLSAKPLRRRFHATLTKDDIEEELWMLVTQEKAAKKDSSEKALGNELKWLELEDDISIICKEIGELLFDELAMEILIHK